MAEAFYFGTKYYYEIVIEKQQNNLIKRYLIL